MAGQRRWHVIAATMMTAKAKDVASQRFQIEMVVKMGRMTMIMIAGTGMLAYLSPSTLCRFGPLIPHQWPTSPVYPLPVPELW